MRRGVLDAIIQEFKEARLRMGKSQIAVSEAIGISNAALSNYETGYREPDLDTLCVLATYYGITLDELVNYRVDASSIIYDMGAIAKNKLIGFNGETYKLKESQKKQIVRELTVLFERFEKNKL